VHVGKQVFLTDTGLFVDPPPSVLVRDKSTVKHACTLLAPGHTRDYISDGVAGNQQRVTAWENRVAPLLHHCDTTVTPL
jgi:hypothetical protein